MWIRQQNRTGITIEVNPGDTVCIIATGDNAPMFRWQIDSRGRAWLSKHHDAREKLSPGETVPKIQVTRRTDHEVVVD